MLVLAAPASAQTLVISPAQTGISGVALTAGDNPVADPSPSALSSNLGLAATGHLGLARVFVNGAVGGTGALPTSIDATVGELAKTDLTLYPVLGLADGTGSAANDAIDPAAPVYVSPYQPVKDAMEMDSYIANLAGRFGTNGSYWQSADFKALGVAPRPVTMYEIGNEAN